MLKTSTSLYKIPYFDIETNMLKSLDRIKVDYHEILCNGTDGMKWQFNYNIEPTLEPLSYRLKGFKWSASLSYNDLGTMSNGIEALALVKINSIIAGLGIGVPAISQKQNEFNNWTYDNNIFWKIKLIEYKGEVYTPDTSLSSACVSMSINSQIWTYISKWSIVAF